MYGYTKNSMETQNVVDDPAHEKERLALEKLFQECMKRDLTVAFSTKNWPVFANQWMFANKRNDKKYCTNIILK